MAHNPRRMRSWWRARNQTLRCIWLWTNYLLWSFWCKHLLLKNHSCCLLQVYWQVSMVRGCSQVTSTKGISTSALHLTARNKSVHKFGCMCLWQSGSKQGSNRSLTYHNKHNHTNVHNENVLHEADQYALETLLFLHRCQILGMICSDLGVDTLDWRFAQPQLHSGSAA